MNELAASLMSTAAPVVIGAAVTYFKLFIEPPQVFRDRIRLTRQTLIERLALHHTKVLQRVRSLSDSDEPLRGDGNETPDLVGDLADNTFRYTSIFYKLEMMRLLVRAAYILMMAFIFFGIIGMLVAILLEPSRVALIFIGMAMAAAQGITVASLFTASQLLEVYEDLA